MPEFFDASEELAPAGMTAGVTAGTSWPAPAAVPETEEQEQTFHDPPCAGEAQGGIQPGSQLAGAGGRFFQPSIELAPLPGGTAGTEAAEANDAGELSQEL
jgi:hypothetical protein